MIEQTLFAFFQTESQLIYIKYIACLILIING